MPSLQYSQYKSKVTALREAIAKDQVFLETLLTQCLHEEIREVTRYVAGSVHDKPFTRVFDECIVCMKKYNYRTLTHPYDKD